MAWQRQWHDWSDAFCIPCHTTSTANKTHSFTLSVDQVWSPQKGKERLAKSVVRTFFKPKQSSLLAGGALPYIDINCWLDNISMSCMLHLGNCVGSFWYCILHLRWSIRCSECSILKWGVCWEDAEIWLQDNTMYKILYHLLSTYKFVGCFWNMVNLLKTLLEWVTWEHDSQWVTTATDTDM